MSSKSAYWLSGYTDNGIAYKDFRYQKDKNTEAEIARLNYRDYTSWLAKYNSDGVVVYRKVTKETEWGLEFQETYTSYSTIGDTEFQFEKTYVYVRPQRVVVACGFPPEVMKPLPSDISSVAGLFDGTIVLASVITTKTVAGPTDTITTTYGSTASIFTADGAANIQFIIEGYTRLYKKETLAALLGAEVGNILTSAIQLVSQQVQTTYGQKAKSTKITKSGGTGGDPDSPPSGSPAFGFEPGLGVGDFDSEPDPDEGFIFPEEPDITIPDIEFGDTDTPTIFPPIDFDYPTGDNIVLDPYNPGSWIPIDPPNFDGWIPDPNNPGQFIPDPNNPPDFGGWEPDPDNLPDFTTEPSTKAPMTYPELQNKVAIGYNNGLELVLPVPYCPMTPFSPLYVEFKGITGQHRSDNTSVVFDQTGILVSTKAMFWGGVVQ